MNIETKIRNVAKRTLAVSITRRKRNRKGFLLIFPDGGFQHHPNKKTALQAMLARMRFAPRQTWSIEPKL